MLHIKIKVRESNIHGLGLFADQDIKKDELIYTVNETLDLSLTNKEFEKLKKAEQDYIKHFGFFEKQTQRWHLSHDDIRFTNHSENANITLKDNQLYALRDITNGEELTQNYAEFEDLREF